MLEATALERVTGSRPLCDWLSALRINAPDGGAPFVEGTEMLQADGTRVLAREACADLTEMFKAAGAGDMRALEVETSRYVTRAERMAKKAPYRRKGWVSGGRVGSIEPGAADAPHASALRLPGSSSSTAAVPDANRAAALRASSSNGEPVSEFAPHLVPGAFGA